MKLKGIWILLKVLWSVRKNKRAEPDDSVPVLLNRWYYEFSPDEIEHFGIGTLRYINEHGKLPERDCPPNAFARSLNTKDFGV